MKAETPEIGHAPFRSDLRAVTRPASCVKQGQGGLTAIDLYSGIGGWALGLRMAGIPVVASYEYAKSQRDTQVKNQGGHVVQCDLRLPLPCAPGGVNLVVGSPPCTEFSLANRGGNGDIENGLQYIARFLEVVDQIKPRYWILENVPRLKSVLLAHIYGSKGKLCHFRHLFEDNNVHIKIFDMAEFGLPQKRKRCIAGKYPADLLDDYSKMCPSRTLGSVLESLGANRIIDPIYGFTIERQKLTEHDPEPPLSREEVRLNRDAKKFHPIYNRMEFPDRPDRPVRAITATCTRVSRESVIIRSSESDGRYRRLTVRERACLQGFPITYQFYANSYSKKIEMIGNAIPPLFVYYIGCSLQGVKPKQIKHPDEISYDHAPPFELPALTPSSGNVKRYPVRRRFRAAIPHLRFKSGVRFELANHFQANKLFWRVTFVFGSSKDIRSLQPSGRLARQLERFLRRHRLFTKVMAQKRLLVENPSNVPAATLQRRWAHLERGAGPYAAIRSLSLLAGRISANLSTLPRSELLSSLSQISTLREPRKAKSKRRRKVTNNGRINHKKFKDNAAALLAGLIVASWYNSQSQLLSSKASAWSSG